MTALIKFVGTERSNRISCLRALPLRPAHLKDGALAQSGSTAQPLRSRDSPETPPKEGVKTDPATLQRRLCAELRAGCTQMAEGSSGSSRGVPSHEHHAVPASLGTHTPASPRVPRGTGASWGRQRGAQRGALRAGTLQSQGYHVMLTVAMETAVSQQKRHK